MASTDKQLTREDEIVTTSYCVNQKNNLPIGWNAVVTMKNGRTAAKGTCRGVNAVGAECGFPAYSFDGDVIEQVRRKIANQASA